MPIDIRAEVSCSLGTVISGSFADDYLQGNGLIKTRGEVVLDGTQTPDVGTQVTLTYDKSGSTYTIPRVLRVMSSFADPFRRTTTVQLGCLLTYLENRKPPVEDPSSKDENSDVPCSVYLKATLPISAEYVFQQCLDALELTSDTIPLTSKFSVEEFDMTPGYIQVMSDLLQSEGYVGYLDSTETLQFIDMTVDSDTGPVITAADVADLGPIGSGELPGESVVVRWNNLRLLPPDELYGDEYLERSWEIEEVFGAPAEVSVSYTDDAGELQTDSDIFYPYSFTATRYDVWDRKIESVSLNVVSSAEINNRWASDAFRAGSLWNIPTGKIVHEIIEYELPAAAQNDVDLMGIINMIGDEGGPNGIKAELEAFAVSHDILAGLCQEEPPEGSDVVKSQTTYNYFSELELAGSLNLDTYLSDGGNLANFDTAAFELDSTVVVEYETDDSSGISKTITKRWVSRSQTVSGQQDMATRVQDLNTSDLVFENSINALLSQARRQIYIGAETGLHTQRQYGLQKRPSEEERNNTANSKPQVSESVAEIIWITGSSESTAVTEFTLPYAPDDAISWDEVTGEFSSEPSDAEQKALRYGEIQNALLLGNRNGVSLQLTPELLPKKPFDPLYLEAGGITGSYRVNGSSWAFDSSGIVASTDALLWGAVSAASGTNLASSWIPLAPGTTSLPLPYTPTSGTTDPETGVTYPAVITPAVVLKPYLESVKFEGICRSSVALKDYPYTLDRGTETQVAATKSKVIVGSKLTADATSYVLAGQAAGRTYSRKVIGAAGSFVATGFSAGSVRSYGIGTNAGTFTLSGPDVVLKRVLAPLTAETGSFVLTGQDATSSGATTLNAATGSFSFSGEAANSIRSYRLGGDAGAYAATGQSAGLGLSDPNFSSVVLLLHMDGANGSTTFIDNSSNAFTVTPLADAKISTAQSKFGGASAAFDGTGDALSLADSEAWNLGGSSFTIECWLYTTSTAASFGIASQRGTATSNHAWSFLWSVASTAMQFRYTSGGSTETARSWTWTPAINTWYHVAVSRDSVANEWRFFVDGTQVGTPQAGSTTIFNAAKPLLIGAVNNNTTTTSPSSVLNGYIDDFRLTKGVARYTANFTPPAAAFPDF